MRKNVKMRGRKLMSLLLAASMTLSMNATAFAEEVEAVSTEEAVTENAFETAEEAAGAEEEAVTDESAEEATENTSVHEETAGAEAEVEAYDPADKNKGDTIGEKDYASVPDNWRINSDPGTWDTATKIVSCNTYYYDEDNKVWEVFSPFSYFFNAEDTAVIDGKVVGFEHTKTDTKYVYRAVPAGSNTYVLLRLGVNNNINAEHGVANADLGESYKVFRWDSAEQKTRVLDDYNTRFNSDEPIVTYSGLKNVVETRDSDGNIVFKKGEIPVFDVDAVLVKHENNKNTLVKGLSVKNVKYKNNLNASMPARTTTARLNTIDDNRTGTRYLDNYNYEVKYTEGKVTSSSFVGPNWKSQLTKTENANFKGQPSLTVALDIKGDAKEYSKDIKKAMKGDAGTFNFEISQLNIGDYSSDTVNNYVYNYEYASSDGNSDDKAAAKKEFATLYWGYVNQYAEALIADENYTLYYGLKKEDVVDRLLVNTITNTNPYHIISGNTSGPEYNQTTKKFIDTITFVAPAYVNQSVDVAAVSNNSFWFNNDISLGIADNEAKNLKFGKKDKVAAKLNLVTSYQVDYADTGMVIGKNEGTNNDNQKVFSYKKLVSKTIKTAKSEAKVGKADAFLKALTVTDDTYGEVKVAVVKGYNDITGSATFRLVADAHGDEEIRGGHYKDDSYYYSDKVPQGLPR